MNNYEISVIVATYNPVWIKLKRTIISILKQKNITYEIIVTDDGSSNNYFSELEQLFLINNFTNYCLVGADKNQGTCRNLQKAIKRASGKYIKLTSPGDCIFDETVLADWYRFAIDNNSKQCFGDAIYYTNENDDINVVSVASMPQNTRIYDKKHYSQKAVILNYLFLQEVVIGSCLITERNLLENYLDKIIGVITYSEDLSYKIMLVDDVSMSFYERPVMWYEYGVGISTGGNSKWSAIIEKERFEVNKYIINNNSLKGFNKFRLSVGLNCVSNNRLDPLKYFIYPELIYWKLTKSRQRRVTEVRDKKGFYDITGE